MPILLAAFALLASVDGAGRIYGIVFVVVLFSVVVQGTSIPFVAPRLGVPMGLREPGRQAKVRVEPGSRAAGRRVVELPLADRTWVATVSRDGRTFAARGSTVLEAGDELTVIADVGDLEPLQDLFGRR